MGTTGEPRFSAGRDSSEDFNTFLEWKSEDRTITWTHAVVDRFDGLSLFGHSNARSEVEWRFKHAPCGFDGTGPRTAVKILVLAGFGSEQELRKKVYVEKHLNLEQ